MILLVKSHKQYQIKQSFTYRQNQQHQYKARGVFRTLWNIYANPASIYLFKNRKMKTPEKSKKKVSQLFWCFHSWLWSSECRLGKLFYGKSKELVLVAIFVKKTPPKTPSNRYATESGLYKTKPSWSYQEVKQ